MDGAIMIVALSLLGLGGLCAHQRRELRQSAAARQGQDDEIRRLRSRLQADEQENLGAAPTCRPMLRSRSTLSFCLTKTSGLSA